MSCSGCASPRWNGWRSAANSVPYSDYSVAERSLFDQLQLRPHAIREEPFSASDDDGVNEHLDLIDKTGSKRVRRESRTVDTHVALGIRFEPSDCIGIELTFNPRPRAARLGERPGVDDLLCCLPHPRIVERKLRQIMGCVVLLPEDHCVVHLPSVEIVAD